MYQQPHKAQHKVAPSVVNCLSLPLPLQLLVHSPTVLEMTPKPPSVFKMLGFVGSQRKWANVAREINFGGSVASVIWSEQPAVETTTRMDIPVRNYVVHA